MTSIPLGLSTCTAPRNFALITFRGSSIGVGKDSGMGTVFVCSFVFRLVGRIDLSLLLEASAADTADEDARRLLTAAELEESRRPVCRFRELELDEEEEEQCGVCGGGLIELEELRRLLAVDEMPMREEDWARLRSIRIFLQMSRRALAIARAGTSHLRR